MRLLQGAWADPKRHDIGVLIPEAAGAFTWVGAGALTSARGAEFRWKHPACHSGSNRPDAISAQGTISIDGLRRRRSGARETTIPRFRFRSLKH